MCSIDLVVSDDSSGDDSKPEDEFAQFVNASVHPPNELSVPRCYPDPYYSEKQKLFQRSKSTSSTSGNLEQSKVFQSSSLSYPSSPRPCLKRESAQDIDDSDGEISYHCSLSPSLYSSQSVSPQLSGASSPSPMVPRHQIFQNKSAPGSPGTKRISAVSPSKDPRHLYVPLSKTRGSSLPEVMEESLTRNKFYLLKQFNIKGSKVIHMGDSFQHRDTSNTSHLSPR